MNAAHHNETEVIRRLLSTPARWAVVGLTNNPRRAARSIAWFLKNDLGMEILPVSLTGEAVLAQPGYRHLADIPGQIDVVDCFVNSQRVGEIIDQAIEVRARAIWMQLGVIDHEAVRRATVAGLDVVMDACPKIEYSNLVL